MSILSELNKSASIFNQDNHVYRDSALDMTFGFVYLRKLYEQKHELRALQLLLCYSISLRKNTLIPE